jgi:hypothetical protein
MLWKRQVEVKNVLLDGTASNRRRSIANGYIDRPQRSPTVYARLGLAGLRGIRQMPSHSAVVAAALTNPVVQTGMIPWNALFMNEWNKTCIYEESASLRHPS